MAKQKRPSTLLRAEWFWLDRWALSEFATLPLEARGMHREMLSLAWARDGRLPSDPGILRMLLRATVEEWDRSWPLVSPHWNEDICGHLTNSEQLETYAVSLKRCLAASAKASHAANSRHKKSASSTSSSTSSSNAPSTASSVLSGSGSGSVSGTGSGNSPPSLPKGGTSRKPKKLKAILSEADEADASGLVSYWAGIFGKSRQTYKLTDTIRRAFAKAKSTDAKYGYADMMEAISNAGKDAWVRETGKNEIPWIIRVGSVDNVQKYRDLEPPVIRREPIKYTPLQQTAIIRAKTRVKAGNLEDAERVLQEQGLSLNGLRAEAQSRLNGHGHDLEVI